MKNLDIRVTHWPTDRLIPTETNPRTHTPSQIDQIAASVQAFGFVSPILVGDDRRIIAGEGRFRAAMKLKMREVPVIVLSHLSDVQRRGLAIADNQIALNAGWDEEKLREQLSALHDDNFDVTLLGFDDQELARQLADLDTAGLTDEDEIPPISINPVTRPGDLWMLTSRKGPRHRLLCGDATDAHDTERLLRDQQVAILMVTDPPYGVELEPEWREAAGLNPRTRQGGSVANDHRTDWSEAWLRFPGNVAYVWHAGIYAPEVALGLQRCEFEIRSQIIWIKQHFVISRGAYHCGHEPCWYAVRKGRTAHWRGDRKQTTVWEIANLNPFGGDSGGENERSRYAEARGGHAPADSQPHTPERGLLRPLLGKRHDCDCGGEHRARLLRYRD